MLARSQIVTDMSQDSHCHVINSILNEPYLNIKTIDLVLTLGWNQQADNTAKRSVDLNRIGMHTKLEFKLL